ncbi:zinc finger protein 436-like [Erpetoichthys calabaricus]|uniref:Zinc finger protein 436-like n=1 Tax=Erpetoichthys calabaricus TaxID=27687 RepID=A0A8C4XHS8_ERPCA|nr:zinc finger protein 436-like [Erpetoichthys calabaricus]
MDFSFYNNGPHCSYAQEQAECESSSDGGAYICTECGEGFTLYPDLQNHMNLHVQEQLPFQYNSYVFPSVLPTTSVNAEYTPANQYTLPVQFTVQENGVLSIVDRPPFYECVIPNSESEQPKDREQPYTDITQGEVYTVPCTEIQDINKEAEGIATRTEGEVREPVHSQFSCESCGKLFNTQQSIQRHQRYHTSDKGYRCRVCCKSFLQRADLCKHVQVHAHEKSYGCGKCGKRFRQLEALKAHQGNHQISASGSEQGTGVGANKSGCLGSGEHYYPCTDCGLRFFWLSDLQNHQCTNSSKTPYSCAYCDKIFYRFSAYMAHRQIHLGERPYECTLCAKSFKQNSDLKRHIRSHTGLKPYKCVLCSKRFVQLTDLRRHHRIHWHTDVAKSLVEQKQNTSLGSFGGLVNGVRKVEKTGRVVVPSSKKGNRPSYPCQICGRCFTHSSSLKRHERFHTGEKPHQCSECGKGFVQGSDLRKHIETHSRQKKKHQKKSGTGEEWLPCPDCGKVFVQHSRLLNHQRTHKARGNYKCTHCRKAFSMLSVFRRHQRYHLKERSFKCTECPQSFRQSSDLNRHLRTHTPRDILQANQRETKSLLHAPNLIQQTEGEKDNEDEPLLFECMDCDEMFSCLQTFLQHQMFHHQKELSTENPSNS